MAIVIQSDPPAVSGTCNVSAGTVVTFSIVSGAPSGSTFKWYSNSVLISTSSSCQITASTLSNVYVEVCEPGGGGLNVIEDIQFRFDDYEFSSGQLYIDPIVSYSYKILSIVIECGPTDTNPTISDVQIDINGTPVVWFDAITPTTIDVTDFPYPYTADSLNLVSVGEYVRLYINGSDTGSPRFIRGKLVVQRT